MFLGVSQGVHIKLCCFVLAGGQIPVSGSCWWLSNIQFLLVEIPDLVVNISSIPSFVSFRCLTLDLYLNLWFPILICSNTLSQPYRKLLKMAEWPEKQCVFSHFVEHVDQKGLIKFSFSLLKNPLFLVRHGAKTLATRLCRSRLQCVLRDGRLVWIVRSPMAMKGSFWSPNHSPTGVWFSYGFPMVSLWFSYGFPMVCIGEWWINSFFLSQPTNQKYHLLDY